MKTAEQAYSHIWRVAESPEQVIQKLKEWAESIIEECKDVSWSVRSRNPSAIWDEMEKLKQQL